MVSLSIGNNIASASTITPTHDVHHITGSTNIDIINVPSPDFCGRVTFIMDGNLDFQTSGNIGRAVNAVIHVCVSFVYDPGLGKWFPDSIP